VSEGKTSMKVKVEVYAQRMNKGETCCIKVTEALLTYVAIDENRRPKLISEN
jgi:acyl-CoA thioesterase YciA